MSAIVFDFDFFAFQSPSVRQSAFCLKTDFILKENSPALLDFVCIQHQNRFLNPLFALFVISLYQRMHSFMKTGMIHNWVTLFGQLPFNNLESVTQFRQKNE